MLSALYYPHISMRSPKLIKNSLLLWDRVNFLAPFNEIQASNADPNLNEALSLITTPYVPSDNEKRLAHEIILELANSNLPDWFFVDFLRPKLKYEIYDRKFLPETWYVLQETNLVKKK